jgi:NDP-sugar pyrophosphorylase family protein
MMRGMFSAAELLDLAHTRFPELFDGAEHAWEPLRSLPGFVAERARAGQRGRLLGAPHISGEVEIGPGTLIEHGALIKGPAIIGADCEIRCGAYIRGSVIVGDGCVLGNGCEFKNCVLFDGAQVPHFSYVGDSILGHKSHLGAGVILSNVKSIQGPVSVRHGAEAIPSGLRKFGAVIGDGAEIGCNCVLAPGSVIGRRAILYPNLLWRGVCPADSIVKLSQQHQIVARRPG